MALLEPLDEFFGENEPPVNFEKTGSPSPLDPLHLDLDDQDFIDVMKDLIKDSQKFWKKHDLYKRRAKNMEYYLGLQISRLESDKQLKKHDTRYLDNLIWEAEQTLKPIALSRIPDLMVKPATLSDQSKQQAKDLEEVINSTLRQRENRRVLGMAYRHRPLFFIGVIKYYWDAEKGDKGDYVFQAISPNQIDMDHTAPYADSQEMAWMAHHYDMTLKEIFMRFPNKEAEYRPKIGLEKKSVLGEKKLATKVTVSEVWFTWYEKQPNSNDYERIEGVAWVDLKRDFVFKKMKNPNWDWEGERIFINLDPESKDRTEIDEDTAREMMFLGAPPEQVMEERYYRNYFEQPMKPFILMGYEQLGEQPMDVTSRIEQVLYLQDNVNKRGKQISDIADHARGKNVFSSESGMTKGDIELIDMSDPNQDIFVDGRVGDVWSFIPGVQPSAALFEEQEMTRSRVFSKVGAHATTRGEREADETATGRQILREGDFSKQDDEVEDTINYAAEQMAAAALQMIKLRYTEDHLVRILGPDGRTVHKTINQDNIEDGMEITVGASAVDKLRRKREAFELAGITMTDPLTFFEDIEAPDPKERTERLMIFTLSPQEYYMKYVKGANGAQDMATMLNGPQQPNQAQPQQQPQQQGGDQEAMMAIAQLQEGRMPPPPQQPTPQFLEAINRFLQSPDFQAAPPNVRQNAAQYAQNVLALVTQQQGGG
jgi:hypothetical protein